VNSHVGQAPGKALAVDGIPIAEQISRSGLVREDVEDLAGGPDCRRMFRDVQVDEFAAVMSKDDEDEKQAKREGRDEEEVDGRNISGMGGEKRAPRGRRSRRRPMHVSRDREFGDAVAEQGQFRPDAPAAPGGILASHALDELAKLGVEPRAAD
jgi:hypothetical protein